jgi:membrane fusion protein (multidrug efflux system)
MRPILVLTLSTLLIAALACGGGEEAGSAADATGADIPVSVETVAATRQPMPDTALFTGSLVAERQVRVAADANGSIVEMRVERGDVVTKGQVIAVVDTALARLNATASAAQAGLASAQLEAAKLDCARAETLFQGGAIAQAQYDRTMAACKAQEEALSAARAGAAIASTQASKTSIRAPFAGQVGDRFVDVGEFVGAQSPVIALYAEGALRLRFSVPERQVSLVAMEAPVSITVPAYEGKHFTGVVRFVSPALRDMTRDLIVEAVIEDPERLLRPGMFAQVELVVAANDQVVVPEAAVQTEGTVNTVYIVREGRAFATVVRVGSRKEGFVTILTDLRAGDTVVLSPAVDLRDGTRVE